VHKSGDTLHAEVQDPLRDLVRAGRLRRFEVAGRFLYTSADSWHARDQLRTRQTARSVPPVVDASVLQVSPDELRAAILLFYSISVGTKKRELAGNFKNPGSRWDLSPRLVNDRDFRSDATGVAIPYGIYDLLANRGSVAVGISHDTSAFAAHAIAHGWRQEGSVRYPRSRQLLILSDSGGSNGSRRRARKTELQSQLADSLGLTLTVAHYPTGASKWNPIEHRLFSGISKNWAGEPLDSYQKILNFIRSTRTQTGLSVTAHLDRSYYPTGTEPTPEQLQALRLKPHEVLPKWNYTISPNP
jgi:hypothetical protein